jgi:HEAT repeat protein
LFTLAITTTLILAAPPPKPAESVDELIRQLGSIDPYVRTVACEELMLLGPKAVAAIPALAKCLADSERELSGPSAPYDATAPELALIRIGPASIPTLTRHADRVPNRKRIVRLAIRQYGAEGEKALPWLIAQLNPNSPDCIGVADTIATLGEKASPAIDALIATYRAASKDQNSHFTPIQDATAQALTAVGSKGRAFVNETAFPDLMKYIATDDFHMHDSVVSRLLTQFGHKAAELYPALAKVIRSDKYFDPWNVSYRQESISPEGRKAIETMLANPDPTVRLGGIDLLAFFEPKAARVFAPALAAIVKDDGVSIRVRAVAAARQAIVLVGESGDAVTEAAATILKVFGSPAAADSEIRSRISYSVSRLGVAAVPSLIQGLRSNQLAVRRLAADVLGQIGPKARAALPALKAMDEVPNSEPWVYVQFARARIAGDKQAAADLARVAMDEKEPARALALVRLSETGPLADPHPEPFFQILAMKDAPDDWKSTAMDTLVDMSSRSPEIALKLADTVSLIEIEKSVLFKDASGIKVILKAQFEKVLQKIESGKDSGSLPIFREIEVLGPEAKTAVPALIKSLARNPWGVQIDMLQSLAALGPEAKEAVPTVLTIVAGKEHHKRIVAMECLAAIGPGAKNALTDIEKLTTDPDPDIRLLATCTEAQITGDYTKHRRTWIRLFEIAALEPQPHQLAYLSFGTESHAFPILSREVPELFPFVKRYMTRLWYSNQHFAFILGLRN